MNNKNCGSCALYRSNSCALSGQRKDKDDFCSQHRKHIYPCQVCGKEYIKGVLYSWDNNNYIEICGHCHEAASTCVLCEHGQHCAFEEDPSSIPKVIPQTIRQGNTIIQTTVKNPERIRKLCHKCQCFDAEENSCNREFNHCGKQKFILEGKEPINET